MKLHITRWMWAGVALVLAVGMPLSHAKVLESWQFKSKITFQGYSKTETLTNFPVLVKINAGTIPGFIYSQCQSALGDDLRFSDSTETVELAYEIELWDTNGTSFAWVQVPTLAGTNTFIYAFWGKSGVPAAPSTTNGAVWNPTDLAVYHFGSTNGVPDARDFTANRRHATVYGTTNVAAGIIGGAQGFNGTTTYLQGPVNLVGYGVSTSFTLTAWVNSTIAGNQILMADGYTYTDAYGYMLINPATKVGYGLRTGTATVGSDVVPAPCSSNEWHMVTQRYDGSAVQIFFDGVWKHTTAKTGTIYTGSNPLYIGRRGNGLYVKGAMDEVRISSAPASTNWIWAAWFNSASNAAFQSYGPAESQRPIISNLPPTYVDLTSAYLNGRLDSAGRTGAVVSVFWGDADGGDPLSGLWKNTNTWAFGAWTNGSTPTHLATGLLANTSYYYRFYAVNEDGDSSPANSQMFSISDVWVEAPDPSASEDGDPGVFAIKRGPTGTGKELTVNYTIGGTAPLGTHYTLNPAGTSVTLPVGMDTTNITVNPVWDGFREGDQTAELSLAPGEYVIVAPATGTVTIVDAVLTVGVNETSAAGDWDDAGKWSLGRIPVAGDEAIVRHAMTLNAETYALATCLVTNGGVITFNGWTTRLQATDVTVGGGSLTLPGPFTNNAMSNRIWIVCTNFTLATNGTVNVDSKGYLGGTNFTGPGWTNTLAAQGPGAGSGQCGAGYGGRGGSTFGFNQTGIGPAYGSASGPAEPGSGGARSATAGGNGGGAVRIEASGTASVSGTITANGSLGLGGGDGGGSGGSIAILCGQFGGSTNGLLRANGGAGNDTGGSGSGGRLAVLYTVSPAVNPGVRFSVTEGAKGSRGYTGQPGTLYLPDTALLTEALSRTQFIDTRLYLGVPEWTVNSLTADGCKLIFASDGFRLNVSNDLRVQTAGRFGFGDPVSTGMTLNIGGSLIVTNGGTFYVYSGITNGVAPDYGCLVAITNDIILATNASKIIPVSHYTNGGSVLFRGSDLKIAAGCSINADSAGWMSGMGPGKGSIGIGNASSGGGYGGAGGSGGTGVGNLPGGLPYGLTNAPIAPGSGGGIGSGFGTYGGGAVRVYLSGKVDINGTISANGGPGNGYYGAGSGGGIMLYCNTLAGGTNSLLSVRGLNGGSRAGGGGGGRIAVAVGLSDADRAKLLLNEPVDKMNVSSNYARFAGQSLIDGGPIGSAGGSNGVPGSVVFLISTARPGSLILIQ